MIAPYQHVPLRGPLKEWAMAWFDLYGLRQCESLLQTGPNMYVVCHEEEDHSGHHRFIGLNDKVTHVWE